MNLKIKLSILLAFVILLVVGLFFTKDKNPTNNTEISNTSDWSVYQNVNHNYSLKYPSDIIHIGPLDAYDYTTPIEQKDAVVLFPAGNEAYDPNKIQSRVEIITFPGKGGNGFNEEENEYFNTLELKEFAEIIRQYQVIDPNQSYTKEVGNLEEITFASGTAYQFSLSGGFARGKNGGGYLLSSPYIYLFAQNSKGEKIMVSYPKSEPISSTIIKSLEIK